MIAWNREITAPLWTARHDGLVNGVVTDHSAVYSAGADRLIRKWDKSSGIALGQTRFERTDDFNSLAICPLEAVIVGGTDDGLVCAYDTETLRLLWERRAVELPVFGQSIECVSAAVQSDRSEIIVGSDTGTLLVLGTDGHLRATIDVGSPIESVCASHDLVWVGTTEGVLMTYDGRTFEELRRRKVHDLPVKAIATDGRNITTTAYDNQIIAMNGRTLQAHWRFPLASDGSRGWARGICMSNSGDGVIATSTLTGAPAVRNAGDGQLAPGDGSPTMGVNALTCRHGRLIAGCDDGWLRLCEGDVARRFVDLGAMVLCLCPHPYRFLVGGGLDNGLVFLVDLTTGYRMAETAPAIGPATACTMSADGKRMYVGHYSGLVTVHAIPDLRLLGQFQCDEVVKSLTVLAPNSLLAVATANGAITIFSEETFERTTGRDQLYLVNAVAWNQWTSELISVNRDLTVRRWTQDLRYITGQCHHQRSIKALAVSPDGRHMATSGYDSTVTIWPEAEGAIDCAGHDAPGVPALLWLDSFTLASGGWDQTVRLWRSDGQLIKTFDLAESE